MRNSVSVLRHVALIEGISFLLLLGIAMPLKYLADMPLAVKLVGWAPGALFVLFCAALVWVMAAAKWPVARGAIVFVASLIPFGPFLLDRRMRQWEQEPRDGGDRPLPATVERLEPEPEQAAGR